MKAIIAILAAIILTGCATQRRCERKFPAVVQSIQKDSVVITHVTRARDTLIYKVVEIPSLRVRDSVVITYETGTLKPLILSGRYSRATAWVAGSKLHGQLDEGGAIELQARVTILEKQVREQKVVVKEKVIEKPVRFVPWWVKALACIGGVALLALLAYLLIGRVLKTLT